MKKDIHPQYNTKAKVICACGNEFVTGSTMDEIKTELCSACHPFYTGKQKLVDSARRVEKFQNKQKAQGKLGERKGRTAKRAAKAAAQKAKTESSAEAKKKTTKKTKKKTEKKTDKK
jgi:large subunit ribosomal protein L31